MPSENTNTSIPGRGLTIQRPPGKFSGMPAPVTNQAGVFPRQQLTRVRSWSIQDRPYNKTLPYTDETSSVESGDFDYEIFSYPGGLSQPPSDPIQYYGDGGGNDLGWARAHILMSTASAKTKVLENMQDAKWNAALFAAEADKTADLIFATAKRLAGAYRAVRTGRWGRACDLLSIRRPSGPRDEWLAYRYGWTPLLSDVASAAEAAASTLVERPLRLKVLKRGSSTKETTVATGSTSSGVSVQVHSGTDSSLRYRIVRTVETQTKAWLEVKASSPTLMRLEQFGLANPAALAWELIPFSFVADWFVGVGDYLNAQTALLGLTVVDGGTSQLSIRTSVGSATGVAAGSQNRSFRGQLPSGAKVTSRKYSRQVWNGSPPPIRVSAELNIKRILDGAALISAVFGNRK